jgi:hypothetical protein
MQNLLVYEKSANTQGSIFHRFVRMCEKATSLIRAYRRGIEKQDIEKLSGRGRVVFAISIPPRLGPPISKSSMLLPSFPASPFYPSIHLFLPSASYCCRDKCNSLSGSVTRAGVRLRESNGSGSHEAIIPLPSVRHESFLKYSSWL